MTNAAAFARIPAEPPPGWEREKPKYRVMRDINPPPKARYRHEPPFTTIMDNSCWQYAERPHKEGEIIETTSWPHPMFHPLNYSAKKVLEFFNGAMKSRMQVAPWSNGSVRLESGLSGTNPQPQVVKPVPFDMSGGASAA